MSLIRVQTTWTDIAGSPYYSNLYTLGPLTTSNGETLATAWGAFLSGLASTLGTGLVSTVGPELLEFDETTGNVTGAGTTTTRTTTFAGGPNRLPLSNQLLIQWHTAGIVHNRRVSGRTFLPGALEEHNGTNGKPSSVVNTPVNSGLTTFMSTMSGRLRVWAQPFEQTDPEKEEKNPTRPGSAHAVTGFALGTEWAVLRSRRQ